jgi:thymidylate synthase (FAD)
MNVELLTHTPHPEKLCALAAKLCYSSGMPKLHGLTPDKAHPLLKKILDSGHMSVLEHVSYTFAIEGISRACSHQLVRHRLASFSMQSQRYVSETEPDYIVPDSVVAAGQEQRFKSAMENAWAFYRALRNAGVPDEDARFVLPNAAETKLIVTMNVRELLHFFNLRCCNRAQWEIRALANAMLKLVQGKTPILFATAGPACVAAGYCPEGSLSCGAAPCR